MGLSDVFFNIYSPHEPHHDFINRYDLYTLNHAAYECVVILVDVEILAFKSGENDASEQLGLGVDISKRIKPEFEVLPRRLVVERTFVWLKG